MITSTSQVGLFLRDFDRRGPPVDALYIVFAGGNDLRDALNALASDPSGAASAAIVGGALSAIRDNLSALYAAGAREFLVANAPDLSLFRRFAYSGPRRRVQRSSSPFSSTPGWKRSFKACSPVPARAWCGWTCSASSMKSSPRPRQWASPM